MRILYIANLRLPAEKAYGIQIAKMCEAFALAGNEVTLTYPFRRNYPENKVSIFEYYSIKNNFKIKRLIAPDFFISGILGKITFHLNNFISAIILCIYGLFSGADIIYSRDELPLYFLSFFKKNLVFEAHKFSNVRSLYYKKFRVGGMKIISITDALKKEFINAGFLDSNVVVAPDGVDLDEFKADVSKKEARIKTGLPQDRTIIMYTGHLFEWKGAHILAEAAEYIPEILFVFVGGTSHDVKQFREKYGQAGNILILGHKQHKEISAFLSAADVLVLPNSIKDKISGYTSPLKLFEYMASNRPIVASDLESIREILNEKNSVLVKPNDPKDLVRGINMILNDGGLAEKIIIQALMDVKNYTWSKRAEYIDTVFRQQLLKIKNP